MYVYKYMVWVHTAPPPVQEPREVEQFRPLVDFSPEALLESLLHLAQFGCVGEGVEVGEDAHDLGEAVDLEDVQELERLLEDGQQERKGNASMCECLE